MSLATNKEQHKVADASIFEIVIKFVMPLVVSVIGGLLGWLWQSHKENINELKLKQQEQDKRLNLIELSHAVQGCQLTGIKEDLVEIKTDIKKLLNGN